MEPSMLHPIKPGCFRSRTDDTSTRHIQYCYSSKKRTLLVTQIRVPLSCWDKDKRSIRSGLPPQFGTAKKLNEKHRDQLRLVEDIITYAQKRNITDKGEFVKRNYRADIEIKMKQRKLKKNDNKKKSG